MSRLVYLKKGDESPVPFTLYNYVEPAGGQLHGPTTLRKLQLATLEVKVSGTDIFVPVAFYADTGQFSIDRFTANTVETPLAVTGDGETTS